jgi:hypothetical protein
MSSPITMLRRQPGRPSGGRPGTDRHTGAARPGPAEARDRTIRRRINIAWGLLYFNTLTYVASSSLTHIPSKIGKAFAQGSLPLAILVLLSVNPKLRLRPNVFMCLMGLLIADSLITAMATPHPGTLFRTFRFAEYFIALWLLTPWFGRRDLLLFRCHLRWLLISLASVLLGLLAAPGKAFAYDGRLSGVIWPMLPTQVAQYAALAIGLTVVLWLGRMLNGRITLVVVTLSAAILLLTHTRTALVGLVAGILVAGLSLFTSNSRVRKFFLAGVAAVTVGGLTVAEAVTTWLARGENAQGLASLTGRTNFWSLVLNEPRTRFEEIFGFGLSNASINGLPIDSNWLASYLQEGLVGVVVCALILIWLFITAFFQPAGVRRALALFLITYCLLASFTEDAFTDVSTYLLDLVVAAALLAVPYVRPQLLLAAAPDEELTVSPVKA